VRAETLSVYLCPFYVLTPLVEIKDDGEDGRLHSDRNRLKVQVQHREYRNVFWACETERGLVQLGFNEALNLIQPLRPFEISRMVFLHN